jgi:hypothetical protein
LEGSEAAAFNDWKLTVSRAIRKVKTAAKINAGQDIGVR